MEQKKSGGKERKRGELVSIELKRLQGIKTGGIDSHNPCFIMFFWKPKLHKLALHSPGLPDTWQHSYMQITFIINVTITYIE